MYFYSWYEAGLFLWRFPHWHLQESNWCLVLWRKHGWQQFLILFSVCCCLFCSCFLMQSNDTTLICQHKSKFSLERLTVNWENWTVHVDSPRSEIWSLFYTQPTVPPIRETDTESKAEWQVLYHQQWQGMEIEKTKLPQWGLEHVQWQKHKNIILKTCVEGKFCFLLNSDSLLLIWTFS